MADALKDVFKNVKTMHIPMTIGWLRWWVKVHPNSGILRFPDSLGGKTLTDKQILAHCTKLKKAGYKYVPCCENIDKEGKCLGVKE